MDQPDKPSKTLPSWGEYKKAYTRMRMVYYALNHGLPWKEVHKKFFWNKITKREYYYWRNIALKQKNKRGWDYENTKWFQLRVDKGHIKDYKWLAFLDRLPIPGKRRKQVKQAIENKVT